MLNGCGSTEAFNAANLTEVQLADNNYQIIATNIESKTSAGYLTGATGLLRISPDRLKVVTARRNGKKIAD